MADPGAPDTAPTTPLRAVRRDPGGSWAWTLPDPVAADRTASAPPHAGPGGFRFLPAAPAGAGRPGAVYRGVRGDRSVADAVRTARPLSADTAFTLPRVLARAVTDRPRPTPPPGPTRVADRLPATCSAFLDHCDLLGVSDAAAVRAALAAEVDTDPDDGADVDAAAVLGLGRVVPVSPHRSGEVEADVLVPAGASSARADAARILAELFLTAALFATAGKASAPSVAAVAQGLGGELTRRWRPWPGGFSATVALLVVDHARRLAGHLGLDGPTVAVELALARRVLDDAPFDPRPDKEF